MFMTLTFNEIVRPTFEREIFSVIKEVVEHYMNDVDIKGKYSVDDVLSMLDKI
jgi:hypothetical protein